MIYNYISPYTTVKTAGLLAAGASSILNRTITLISYGYGTPSEYMNEEIVTLNKNDKKDLYLYVYPYSDITHSFIINTKLII